MNANKASVLTYLLGVCRSIYEPRGASAAGPPPECLDLKELFELARENKLLSYLVRTDPRVRYDADSALRQMVDQELMTYQNYSAKLAKTLSCLDSVLGPGSYLVIKTIYGYPRITKDLDIVVKDLTGSVDMLISHGFHNTFNEPPYKQTVQKNGLLSITVHERVAWRRVVPMDLEFLWKNTRTTRIDGSEVQIPSVEADLMMAMAHVLFESVYLNLGDLLFSFQLSDRANWLSILDQARINNWSKALVALVSIMNGFHRYMYGTSSPMEKWVPEYRFLDPEFPVRCPLQLIVRAHVEKGAWQKVLSFLDYFKKRY